MQRLLHIDRRIIFLAVAVVILLGQIIRPVIPMPTSAEARRLYDAVEAVPQGGAIIVALDYGPASADELDAMARAVLHHAFSRNLRVLAVCFDQQGVAQAERMLTSVGEALGKKAGRDYVFLGFQPDMTAAIVQMGTSIADAFPQVVIGGETTATAQAPVMRDIANFGDVALAVQMTGSKSYEKWIDFANARFGLRLAVGATGAIVTGLYPYLSSNQITGLLRSTRGASDYERLVRDRYPGLAANASIKMSVQFLAHLLVLAFVLLANVGYWLSRRTPSGAAE